MYKLSLTFIIVTDTLTVTAPLMYFIAVTLGIVNGTPPHIRSDAMSSSGKYKNKEMNENNEALTDNDICHEVTRAVQDFVLHSYCKESKTWK